MRTTSWNPPTRPLLAGLTTVLLALGAAACGGDDSELSEIGQLGKNTSNANGCASCHGANAQGGVGPGWIDLAGSEREIEAEGGGTTTVVADDDYLLRAILEPDAEVVVGYTIQMPTNGLSEAEAETIVQYIKELSSSDSE